MYVYVAEFVFIRTGAVHTYTIDAHARYSKSIFIWGLFGVKESLEGKNDWEDMGKVINSPQDRQLRWAAVRC